MANRYSDKKNEIHFNKFFSLFQNYCGEFLKFQITYSKSEKMDIRLNLWFLTWYGS